jgi:hypothetical protein
MAGTLGGDALHSSLTDLGFTQGTINDRLFEYFLSEGHTGALDDMWDSWLRGKGFNNIAEYLLDLGYTGQIDGAFTQALVDGAFFGASRDDYWFCFNNPGSRVTVPFGTAGIVRDDDPIIIQMSLGTVNTNNTGALSAGTYNQTDAFAAGPVISVIPPDGDQKMRIYASASQKNNIHSQEGNKWTVHKYTIDTVGVICSWECYDEALGEGTGDSGDFAISAGSLNAWTVANDLVIGHPTNALFGGMTGCIKNVYLYQGTTEVGFWMIDDNSTTIADSSGNGNDGTLTPGIDTWVASDPYP